MLRPNDGSATYQDLSLETIRKARRISRLTPNAGRSLVVRGFGDSCSAGRWRRVSTTHKRPASPPLEREPFACARFSRQQEQRVCAPPSKKRKNTERVCGDPLLPLPVASLPPHSPVPWGVALTNTMAVLPLVPGQATRRCPRQPPMLRNPATPATGFRRVFLLFFLLGGAVGNRSRRRCRLLYAGVPWPLTVCVAVPVLRPVLQPLVLRSRCPRLWVHWRVRWLFCPPRLAFATAQEKAPRPGDRSNGFP